MGDFFSPPPGYPELPAEPDIPIPNFQTVGQGLATGMNQSGFWQHIWDGFLQACAQVLTWALAWILKAAISIAAWFIGVLTSSESDAGASYGLLVANTLNNVFGVQVSPAQVNTRGPAGQKQAVANQLAQSILGTMFTGAAPKPEGGLTPTDAPANLFLATTANLALNGWLESWVTDALSLHELQRFGDLKDVMARVLGLGRMSRQVFSPPIKILVHDPYLALLSQKYRPKGLNEAGYIRLYFAGKMTRPDLSTSLGNEGYSEAHIDHLIAEQTKQLSLADVDYLVSHGTWNTGQGLQYIQRQGYDVDGANLVYAIEVDRRIDKYRREMCTVAEAAYVKGDITLGQLQSTVSSAGIANDEQQWFLQVAQLKQQFHITHLSLGQIEEGILDGILNLNDLKNWAIREGMPFTEEQELELEVLFKQSRQTAAAAAKAAAAKAKATAAVEKQQAATLKVAQATAQAADKGVTVGQAEQLVKDGLWTFNQLTAFLATKDYGPDAINSIVALLHAEMAKSASTAAAATGVHATAAAKGLSLADMERAVIAGHRSISDLQTFLSGQGFNASDAQVIVELVTDQIQAAQVRAAAKAAAALKSGSHNATLTEIERAVILGLTPMATYTDALHKAGFDAMSITLLSSIAAADLAKAQSTAAKKGTPPPGGTGHAITLAQLEAEILGGLRPITDYTAALVAAGYSVTDQQDLTALLKTKIDQAAATAAQKQAAGTALKDRGISLVQAERAVKLGVVPIDTYKSMLKAAGFTTAAVDVLSSSLLAEVAKTSKAKIASTTAAGTAATKGITLPEIEAAIVAGIKPITDYSAALTAAGYSAADVATLTELVQLKADHAADVQATHSDAEGQATQKGISLGAEERAVIAGDLGMNSYDALLISLGYDAIDRQVLEQLLQSKVDAAAAKAAG